ncbi:hypothetical protein [Tenacibaculum finnmarkense]|uniref:hypothetical protein n=1 Tax=Tenacibaculum finnmarkense TaxID=2781243 RepID=UPI001E4686FC|nr:hypothetical protein [Tenacibaculum finnmarkense]MCD8411097.1 hypothetical protein [Tenacibaculum finnmarkense genomovar ulcerans]
MTFNDYKKTGCLEFNYLFLSDNRYKYFIRHIDKSGNSERVIYITYDFYQFNSAFVSSNFIDLLILGKIKYFLVKALLGFYQINFIGENIDDLFCKS